MPSATVIALPARPPAMASRWRRRVACTLIADRDIAGVLVEISGRSAIVQADGATFGASVMLAHPVAGRIAALVGAHTPRGLKLHLAGDTDATGFAMTVIAADMTRGG